MQTSAHKHAHIRTQYRRRKRKCCETLIHGLNLMAEESLFARCIVILTVDTVIMTRSTAKLMQDVFRL